jgi:hypothetical protein
MRRGIDGIGTAGSDDHQMRAIQIMMKKDNSSGIPLINSGNYNKLPSLHHNITLINQPN